MFSGIVEKQVKVKEIAKVGENVRICVDLEDLAEGVKLGDSISINGACLTITRLSSNVACFEAISETLNRTNLGMLRPGNMVNVERSLRLIDRLGGHLVTGHVDHVGRIVKREDSEGASKLWIEVPRNVVKMVIPKGSVALDGVSLTVVDVEETRFSVYLIPHTLNVTTLEWKKEGDLVNVETDIIGKYVKRFLDSTLKHQDQL